MERREDTVCGTFRTKPIQTAAIREEIAVSAPATLERAVAYSRIKRMVITSAGPRSFSRKKNAMAKPTAISIGAA